MASMFFALALAAQAPSAEAQQLGRRLAEEGTLAALLPLLKAKETEELVKEEPNLSTTEQAELRATADRVFQAGYDRLMKATGDAYARELTVRDLRSLTHFYGSSVTARYRAGTPNVIIETMKSIGAMDFKGDVRTAFCAEAKRLCQR